MWDDVDPWAVLGKFTACYMVGVVVTFLATSSRRNERVIGAFSALQRMQRRRATEDDPLHTIFRISASAIWPLFWIAGLLAARS